MSNAVRVGQMKRTKETHQKRCLYGDKVKYSKRKQALSAANQRASLEDCETYVYVCRFCGYYHTGTEGKRLKLCNGLDRLNQLLAPS